MSVVKDRQPGKALDVGMGQGRNAVFLAQHGWEVTGIDPSDEAIRLAQNNARVAGVGIETRVAGDDTFDFGTNRWDLIVVMYIRDLNVEDAGRIWKALKPGGILVYENGADTRNQVLRSFLRFQILRFEDVDDVPDWHPDRRIRVQRLAAQKVAGP
jgi:2-polyprenyl-3-methyl-5-hydroxy-6-metoxy-1,4-benzoquinol methylase